jgi:Fe-S-cluster containining protein
MVREAVAAVLISGRDGAAALEAARQVEAWADQLVAGFEDANPLPRPLACQEGCCYCCFNPVQVTAPEALLIANFIGEELPPEAQTRLWARVAETLQRSAGLSLDDIARERQAFPCPLLDKDRCVAHAVRPLVCRAMHSFDAAQCREEFERQSLTPVSYYAHRYEIILSLSQGLSQACRAAGCQSGPVSLPQALMSIRRQEGSGDRWVQGEVLFETQKS